MILLSFRIFQGEGFMQVILFKRKEVDEEEERAIT